MYHTSLISISSLQFLTIDILFTCLTILVNFNKTSTPTILNYRGSQITKQDLEDCKALCFHRLTNGSLIIELQIIDIKRSHMCSSE